MTFRNPKTWKGDVDATDLNRELRDPLRELRSAVLTLESTGGATLPVGAILLSGRVDSLVASGWLVCDGQLVDKTTYADLWACCGTAYGADTLTQFRLPDMTNRFVRGATNAGDGTITSRGSTGGYNTNSLTLTSNSSWSIVTLGATNSTHNTHTINPSHTHNTTHGHTWFATGDSHSHGANSHDHGGLTPVSTNANRAAGSSTPNVSPNHQHTFTASTRGTNNDAHLHTDPTGSSNSSGSFNTSNDVGTTNTGTANVTSHSHSTTHDHSAAHNHVVSERRPVHTDVNYLIKALNV